MSLIKTEETFENYTEIDEDVAISSILKDDNTPNSVRDIAVDIDNIEENMTKTVPRILLKQAKAALILLRTFTEQSSNVDDKMYSANECGRKYH